MLQAEKDLISAVHLMADYGLDMPPLKIRLTQDRLQLIDLVLQHGGKAYRNASRLLRLGQLLRCSGTSGPAAAAAAGSSASSSASAAASGPIYVRIAEAALVRRDLDTACQMCSKLRAANEPTGWSVCRRLADDDEVICDGRVHEEPSSNMFNNHTVTNSILSTASWKFHKYMQL